MRAVRERKVLGHIEHPEDGRTDLLKAAIVVTDITMRENGEVVGKLETLSTPHGKIASALFEDGITVGISSRGRGSVVTRDDGIDEVQDDYVMETFDLVADPSTYGAELRLGEGKEATKQHILNESVKKTLKEAEGYSEEEMDKLTESARRELLLEEAKAISREPMRAFVVKVTGPEYATEAAIKSMARSGLHYTVQSIEKDGYTYIVEAKDKDALVKAVSNGARLASNEQEISGELYRSVEGGFHGSADVLPVVNIEESKDFCPVKLTMESFKETFKPEDEGYEETIKELREAAEKVGINYLPEAADGHTHEMGPAEDVGDGKHTHTTGPAIGGAEDDTHYHEMTPEEDTPHHTHMADPAIGNNPSGHHQHASTPPSPFMDSHNHVATESFVSEEDGGESEESHHEEAKPDINELGQDEEEIDADQLVTQEPEMSPDVDVMFRDEPKVEPEPEPEPEVLYDVDYDQMEEELPVYEKVTASQVSSDPRYAKAAKKWSGMDVAKRAAALVKAGGTKFKQTAMKFLDPLTREPDEGFLDALSLVSIGTGSFKNLLAVLAESREQVSEADVSGALRYIKSLRSKNKRAYAKAYFDYVQGNGDDEDPDERDFGLSYMGGQAVRMNLADFGIKESLAEKVFFGDSTNGTTDVFFDRSHGEPSKFVREIEKNRSVVSAIQRDNDHVEIEFKRGTNVQARKDIIDAAAKAIGSTFVESATINHVDVGPTMQVEFESPDDALRFLDSYDGPGEAEFLSSRVLSVKFDSKLTPNKAEKKIREFIGEAKVRIDEAAFNIKPTPVWRIPLTFDEPSELKQFINYVQRKRVEGIKMDVVNEREVDVLAPHWYKRSRAAIRWLDHLLDKAGIESEVSEHVKSVNVCEDGFGRRFLRHDKFGVQAKARSVFTQRKVMASAKDEAGASRAARFFNRLVKEGKAPKFITRVSAPSREGRTPLPGDNSNFFFDIKGSVSDSNAIKEINKLIKKHGFHESVDLTYKVMTENLDPNGRKTRSLFHLIEGMAEQFMVLRVVLKLDEIDLEKREAVDVFRHGDDLQALASVLQSRFAEEEIEFDDAFVFWGDEGSDNIIIEIEAPVKSSVPKMNSAIKKALEVKAIEVAESVKSVSDEPEKVVFQNRGSVTQLRFLDRDGNPSKVNEAELEKVLEHSEKMPVVSSSGRITVSYLSKDMLAELLGAEEVEEAGRFSVVDAAMDDDEYAEVEDPGDFDVEIADEEEEEEFDVAVEGDYEESSGLSEADWMKHPRWQDAAEAWSNLTDRERIDMMRKYGMSQDVIDDIISLHPAKSGMNSLSHFNALAVVYDNIYTFIDRRKAGTFMDELASQLREEADDLAPDEKPEFEPETDDAVAQAGLDQTVDVEQDPDTDIDKDLGEEGDGEDEEGMEETSTGNLTPGDQRPTANVQPFRGPAASSDPDKEDDLGGEFVDDPDPKKVGEEEDKDAKQESEKITEKGPKFMVFSVGKGQREPKMVALVNSTKDQNFDFFSRQANNGNSKMFVVKAESSDAGRAKISAFRRGINDEFVEDTAHLNVWLDKELPKEAFFENDQLEEQPIVRPSGAVGALKEWLIFPFFGRMESKFVTDLPRSMVDSIATVIGQNSAVAEVRVNELRSGDVEVFVKTRRGTSAREVESAVRKGFNELGNRRIGSPEILPESEEMKAVMQEIRRGEPEKFSAKRHYKSVMKRLSRSMPAIDMREYPRIPGLEGPFVFRNGRVAYYDPKEGKYYDPKTDLYLTLKDIGESVEDLEEGSSQITNAFTNVRVIVWVETKEDASSLATKAISNRKFADATWDRVELTTPLDVEFDRGYRVTLTLGQSMSDTKRAVQEVRTLLRQLGLDESCHVEEALEEASFEQLTTDGNDNPGWVLLDTAMEDLRKGFFRTTDWLQWGKSERDKMISGFGRLIIRQKQGDKIRWVIKGLAKQTGKIYVTFTPATHDPQMPMPEDIRKRYRRDIEEGTVVVSVVVFANADQLDRDEITAMARKYAGTFRDESPAGYLGLNYWFKSKMNAKKFADEVNLILPVGNGNEARIQESVSESVDEGYARKVTDMITQVVPSSVRNPLRKAKSHPFIKPFLDDWVEDLKDFQIARLAMGLDDLFGVPTGSHFIQKVHEGVEKGQPMIGESVRLRNAAERPGGVSVEVQFDEAADEFAKAISCHGEVADAKVSDDDDTLVYVKFTEDTDLELADKVLKTALSQVGIRESAKRKVPSIQERVESDQFYAQGREELKTLREKFAKSEEENIKLKEQVESLQKENEVLRDLNDEMAKLQHAENLKNHQERLFQKYPHLEAVSEDFDKCETVEELDSLAERLNNLRIQTALQESGDSDAEKGKESGLEKPLTETRKSPDGIPSPKELANVNETGLSFTEAKASGAQADNTVSRFARFKARSRK